MEGGSIGLDSFAQACTASVSMKHSSGNVWTRPVCTAVNDFNTLYVVSCDIVANGVFDLVWAYV